jgi:hypothetical protein
MSRALGVGDVITAAEPDYCYGVGELHLRVTKVGPVYKQCDGDWISVEGVTVRPDGTVHEERPRHALVRVRGIRRQARSS